MDPLCHCKLSSWFPRQDMNYSFSCRNYRLFSNINSKIDSTKWFIEQQWNKMIDLTPKCIFYIFIFNPREVKPIMKNDIFSFPASSPYTLTLWSKKNKILHIFVVILFILVNFLVTMKGYTYIYKKTI